MLTQAQVHEAMNMIIAYAEKSPGARMDLMNAEGHVVAFVQVLESPKRPTRPADLPRAQRPKQKLSKRQRAHARAAKSVVS